MWSLWWFLLVLVLVSTQCFRLGTWSFLWVWVGWRLVLLRFVGRLVPDPVSTILCRVSLINIWWWSGIRFWWTRLLFSLVSFRLAGLLVHQCSLSVWSQHLYCCFCGSWRCTPRSCFWGWPCLVPSCWCRGFLLAGCPRFYYSFPSMMVCGLVCRTHPTSPCPLGLTRAPQSHIMRVIKKTLKTSTHLRFVDTRRLERGMRSWTSWKTRTSPESN